MSLPIVRVNEVSNYENQDVELRGWLYNKRSSGKLHFLQVRDGSGIVQCVMSKAEVGDEVFARADTLTQETSIMVRGTVREDARPPIGVELGAAGLEVVGVPTAEFPISPKE